MNNIKTAFNDSAPMINKNIHKFLFSLLYKIFLKKTITLDLDVLIKKINAKIIKKKENYISTDFTIENFNNIINFVKNQNRIFAGEIIERILIIIFSDAIKAEREDSFSKYIFNNLSAIKKKFISCFEKWLQEDKFLFSRLDLKELLELNFFNLDKKNYPFFYLLFTINKEKYKHIHQTNQNTKTMMYINRGTFDSLQKINKYFDLLEDNAKTIYEKDITMNSISSFISNIYDPKDFTKIHSFNIDLIKDFFISVYIYYQNKNSPLMNYIQTKNSYDEKKKNKKELSNIPFEYNLNGVCAEGRNSPPLISPIMIEPRISKISITMNNIREIGLYDLSKVLIFNKNIKDIRSNFALIRTNYLDFINFGFGIFDNNSVEYLDLSNNFLKEDSEEYLPKLMSHFKGLKTIILSGNDIKRGMSSFFIALKKLYRKGKTKLENLYLNKCSLDDSSFYELGELLKSRFCKLKKLYLNCNKMPEDINFLKKLKNNKSLTEIYLGKNDIYNKNINDILKIISNTHIRHLYLNKNRISNINKCLNVIYRTKIIKNEYNYNVDKKSFLINLDLSDNNFNLINPSHIKLFTKIVNESTLNCLDFSHIIYGENPSQKKYTKENIKYRQNVDELLKNLDEKKNNYTQVISELRTKKVDIKRLTNLEDEKTFQNLDDKIKDIIKDKKANFTVFLKKNAKILMNIEKVININENNNKDYKNSKKEIQKIEQKLVNYMKLKKSIKDFEQLKEEIKDKKLILL